MSTEPLYAAGFERYVDPARGKGGYLPCTFRAGNCLTAPECREKGRKGMSGHGSAYRNSSNISIYSIQNQMPLCISKPFSGQQVFF